MSETHLFLERELAYVYKDDLERLRRIEKAAQAFLDAAALESMTKASEYIAAKRRLRAALRIPA